MTDKSTTQYVSHTHLIRRPPTLKLNKTALATVVAVLAVLAVPAAAQAEKPQNAGAQGKAKAEQQRGAKAQKPSKAKKAKGVGFTLSGTGLSGLTGTTLTGPLTLDLVSANKHARQALKVDRAFVAGPETLAVPVAEGDAFTLKLDGITDGSDEGSDVSLADVVATDTVKVIGKVARTRTKSKGSKPAFTYGAIDIRNVVITREAPEAAPAS